MCRLEGQAVEKQRRGFEQACLKFKPLKPYWTELWSHNSKELCAFEVLACPTVTVSNR